MGRAKRREHERDGGRMPVRSRARLFMWETRFPRNRCESERKAARLVRFHLRPAADWN